ncbi:MAG: hypothetical protein JHC84_06025 [Solirubrobacteraceae bacterium]|nr:hypothetical protein [Solirubrobacteraceae bacterium]
MLETVVKPEYRPTLPTLLRPLRPWQRWGIVALLVLPLVVGAWVATGGAREAETQVVIREPIAFNLAYGPRLTRVDDQSTALRLEQRRGDLFIQSFAVKPLTLPPYEGTPAGALPLTATEYERELERTYDDFTLVREGRTRINQNPGYEIIFRAKLEDRTLYGRHILLVPAVDEDENLVLDAQREGVIIEMAATPVSGTPNAESTGNVGALKKPLRTFRFGTERSGGAES